ncbi:hypothetical protein DRN74_04515 [Candidatus Micrarchaeota archaeon]|nr:MAG: hypothetical protein DRN74_04515 [Candidatus Micrarchaeota archaeon]
MILKARVIKEGHVRGKALVSKEPIGFYGNIDPETGVVIEKGHPLEGKSVANKILVFPTGKGSTVGSYTMYRLKKNGKAPLAILCEESEAIIAVGAIISNITMLDKIDISKIKTDDDIEIKGDEVRVNE